jgi:hypothetical protein
MVATSKAVAAGNTVAPRCGAGSPALPPPRSGTPAGPARPPQFVLAAAPRGVLARRKPGAPQPQRRCPSRRLHPSRRQRIRPPGSSAPKGPRKIADLPLPVRPRGAPAGRLRLSAQARRPLRSPTDPMRAPAGRHGATASRGSRRQAAGRRGTPHNTDAKPVVRLRALRASCRRAIDREGTRGGGRKSARVTAPSQPGASGGGAIRRSKVLSGARDRGDERRPAGEGR